MADNGSLRYDDLIPYRANLYGEEKDFELQAQAVSLLLARLELSLGEQECT